MAWIIPGGPWLSIVSNRDGLQWQSDREGCVAPGEPEIMKAAPGIGAASSCWRLKRAAAPGKPLPEQPSRAHPATRCVAVATVGSRPRLAAGPLARTSLMHTKIYIAGASCQEGIGTAQRTVDSVGPNAETACMRTRGKDAAVAAHDVDDFLARHVPITQAMGIRLRSWGVAGVTITAPLKPNINDKGIAFGGTLASILALSGWRLSSRRWPAPRRASTQPTLPGAPPSGDRLRVGEGREMRPLVDVLPESSGSGFCRGKALPSDPG